MDHADAAGAGVPEAGQKDARATETLCGKDDGAEPDASDTAGSAVRDAILFGQREHTQEAAHRDFPVIAMQALAESANVLARLFTTRQQLPRGQRGL